MSSVYVVSRIISYSRTIRVIVSVIMISSVVISSIVKVVKSTESKTVIIRIRRVNIIHESIRIKISIIHASKSPRIIKSIIWIIEILTKTIESIII